MIFGAVFLAIGIGAPGRAEPGDGSGARGPRPEIPPLPPGETVRATHVREGFVLELVAAEPLVRDPVAIDWGADGRLWVVEMADYPYGMDGKGKAGGRVRYLEDTDDDGRYDKSTVFLDRLRFPTSVMEWRDGVLVTAAPDLIFARDTNGDGRADDVRTLYSGFIEGNQQLRVNSLRWGLDNFVHCASGAHHAGFGRDTRIVSPVGGKFRLGSRDFRFQPDTLAIEAESGPSQFGRVRDDWGNWFGVQNSWLIWHYVLKERYMRRNPHYAAPDARKQLRTPGNPKVYSNKPLQKRFHSFEQSGRYTSACGPCVYRGEHLFSRQPGLTHAFTCEPFHNVVQHHHLRDDGVSFQGERAADDGAKDFFASGDRWCRPVMARTGPDGALYVVDMYRYMIEHPDWLPPNGKEELEPFYRSGEDLGRIYRIRKKGGMLRRAPRLAERGDSVLVDALRNGNGVIRDQAHRLLVERNAVGTSEDLRQLIRTSPSARIRLQSLCVLDGLGTVTFDDLERGMHDGHPAVVAATLRLAEKLPPADRVKLLSAIELGDVDPRVSLQAAFTLGECDSPDVSRELVTLAKKHGDNAFMVAAVMSSSTAHAPAMFRELGGHPAYAEALFAMALDQREHLPDLLGGLLPPSAKTVGIAKEYLSVLDQKGVSIQSLKGGADARLDDAVDRLSKLFDFARTIIREDPAACILLAREPEKLADDLVVMGELLEPGAGVAVSEAALDRLGGLGSSEAANIVIDHWPRLTGGRRNQALDVMLRRSSWAALLLREIEENRIPASLVSPARRQQLIKGADPEVARRAAELFRVDPSKTGGRHRGVLAVNGEVETGRPLYAERCAVCHSLEKNANLVGPDLRSISDRTKAGLLSSILLPSEIVDPSYIAYSVNLKNGEAHFGLITSETESSFILKFIDGTERTFLRGDVAGISGTNVSLMPPGLLEGLSDEQLAGLIAFVQSLGGE